MVTEPIFSTVGVSQKFYMIYTFYTAKKYETGGGRTPQDARFTGHFADSSIERRLLSLSGVLELGRRGAEWSCKRQEVGCVSHPTRRDGTSRRSLGADDESEADRGVQHKEVRHLAAPVRRSWKLHLLGRLWIWSIFPPPSMPRLWYNIP